MPASALPGQGLMASFLTQCPGCMTSFRVTDAQLEAAEGMVRCGACLSVFSAPANRITLRNPVDPSQVPVLAPDAELEDELDAAGYDALPLDTRADETDDADDADEEQDEEQDEDEANVEVDGDRDVPLGDLDLNLHAYEDEDEEFEDDEDEEFDDEHGEFDDDEHGEFDDDEHGEFDDDEDDEFDADEDDEFDADEDDVLSAEDDDDIADDENEEGEPAEHEPQFRIVEEYIQEPELVDEVEYETDVNEDEDEDEPVDKRELREYLAALEDEDALEPLDDYDLDALSEPVTISERQTVRRTLRFMGLLLLNLVLIAVLMLQYVNANLDTLSRSQRLAPLMNRVCQVLECPLPQQSDLGSLSSQDLLVRSHPRYTGALEVSFIFRNDAPDSQPFPAIELGFSDAANQVIANRLFQPADYLPPELQQLQAMPGQATLQIMLELADPGSEAVNYNIGFRAP